MCLHRLEDAIVKDVSSNGSSSSRWQIPPYSPLPLHLPTSLSSLPILKFSPSFLEHTTRARCQKTLDLCAPSLAAREEERGMRERERKASSSLGGDRYMVRENPLLLKLVRCRESLSLTHTHTHTHTHIRLCLC